MGISNSLLLGPFPHLRVQVPQVSHSQHTDKVSRLLTLMTESDIRQLWSLTFLAVTRNKSLKEQHMDG